MRRTEWLDSTGSSTFSSRFFYLFLYWIIKNRYDVISNLFSSPSTGQLSRRRGEMMTTIFSQRNQSHSLLVNRTNYSCSSHSIRNYTSHGQNGGQGNKKDALRDGATSSSKDSQDHFESSVNSAQIRDSNQSSDQSNNQSQRTSADQRLTLDQRRIAAAATSSDPQKFNPSKPYHNYPRSLRELALRAFNSNSSNSNTNQQSTTSTPIDDPQSIPKSLSKDSSSSSSPPTSPPTTTSTWTRPTKEDLLNLAHGFWTRARIRFKWFTIRGFRRFNVDDLSAFFTLGGLGTILFIVIGTTTAVSVVFAGLNLLNMQGESLEWIQGRRERGKDGHLQQERDRGRK